MTSGSPGRYAVVHARVRAMYGDMLKQSDWLRLMAAPDFTSMVDELKETMYGSLLEAHGDHLGNARRVEYEIRKRLAKDFKIIIQNAPEHVRPLMTQLFRLYEVDNLKAVLRGIEIGLKYDHIRYMLFPMEDFPTLPYERMADAETIAGALEVIRDSGYYGTLTHALERYTAEKSLFPLEVALDLEYWREVWKNLNGLPRKDKASAVRLIGMVVDNNNLMWAARYRVYHHLSEEEIINYTLPFGYKVNDALIRRVAAGEDVIQQVTEVYPELSDVLESMHDEVKDLPVFELQLQRLFMSRCRSSFYGYPFHIGILLAYVFLLEMEIQDLTVLLEAKTLGIDPSNYQSYLLVGDPAALKDH